MAIDRMKKITVVCQVSAAQRLIKRLHELGIVELTDAIGQFPEAEGRLKRQDVATEECDRHLHKINLILALLDLLAPEKKGFIAGLAPVPLIIGQKELDSTLSGFDIEAQFAAALELDSEYRRIERSMSDIQGQLKDLLPLEDIPIRVPDLKTPKRVSVVLGLVPQKNYAAFSQDPTIAKLVVWEMVLPGKFARKDAGAAGRPGPEAFGEGPVRIVAAFLPADAADARKAMSANGFEETSLPDLKSTVRDHVRELREDLTSLQTRVESITGKVQEMTIHRRPLLVLRAFWENRKQLALARGQSAHSRWLQILTGYIRERDLALLEQTITKEFEHTTIQAEDPGPDDAVPVSISLPNSVRPIQMLVNLFGLPAYQTFDPSPFMIFGFLFFFGMCFSDVGYGVMLLGISVYIMLRTRQYEGLYNFAKLLMYGSVSTIIFGLLFGSFFGDLYKPEYMGEGNPVARLMALTQIIDPVEKPVTILVVSLFIGILNQFYGIALKMYGALLRGDKAEAYYDSLMWLILLPGVVVMISCLFVTPPAVLFYLGILMLIVGSIGLILTQGRSSEGLVSRFLVGIVSLYGIVGSYGVTAFIGDTMSYCRLLALGLTTSIVALSFNMMAALLKPIPYAGFFLFIAAVIFAHVFNFAISVLGAFVHSMRLIFVEFFGRFYATGSRPFAPLGFNSRTAVLRKDS